jgi:hypothetical protein
MNRCATQKQDQKKGAFFSAARIKPWLFKAKYLAGRSYESSKNNCGGGVADFACAVDGSG